MSTIVDTLATVFVLDSRGYQSGAEKVLSLTGRLGQGIEGLAKRVFNLPNLLAGGLIGKAVSGAVSASNDIESLRNGLEALTGSAKEADEQFRELRAVGKLPGVGGLDSAVRQSERLEEIGNSAAFAERAITQFGNALSIAGRGKNALNGVVDALIRIQGSGQINARSLTALGRQIPEIYGIIRQAYGTTDGKALQGMNINPADFINKVIQGLEKLPRYAGGGKQAFQNLGDSWKVFVAGFGDAIKTVFGPAADKVTRFLDYLTDSGALTKITNGFKNLFGGDLGDTLVKGLSWVLATIQAIPQFVEGLRSTLSGAFDQISKHTEAFAAILGAVFLGGTMVRAISAVVEAFIALRDAIAATSIMEVILQAAAGGAAAIAKALAGLAAGAAAGYGIYQTIKKLFGDGGLNFGNLPGVDQIAKNQKAILNGFGDGGGSGGAPGGHYVSDGEGNRLYIPPPPGTAAPMNQETNQTLKKIQKAVEKTADITEQLFGGSTNARNVTSAYGQNRIGRGSASDFHTVALTFADTLEAMFNSNQPLIDRNRMSR
jgi:hypothetical protein